MLVKERFYSLIPKNILVFLIILFNFQHSLASEKEIEKITSVLRAQGQPDYIEEITFSDKSDSSNTNKDDESDELYSKALDIIKSEGKASTSFLQRKLQIGYNRAARIIDTMEDDGIISKANHVGKRDVL